MMSCVYSYNPKTTAVFTVEELQFQRLKKVCQVRAGTESMLVVFFDVLEVVHLYSSAKVRLLTQGIMVTFWGVWRRLNLNCGRISAWLINITMHKLIALGQLSTLFNPSLHPHNLFLNLLAWILSVTRICQPYMNHVSLFRFTAIKAKPTESYMCMNACVSVCRCSLGRGGGNATVFWIKVWSLWSEAVEIRITVSIDPAYWQLSLLIKSQEPIKMFPVSVLEHHSKELQCTVEDA